MTPEQVVSLGPAFTAYLRDFEDYFGNDLLLRQVIREAVSRIELRWERRSYGAKTRYVVTGGVIHLHPQLGHPALHVKPCNSSTSGPAPAST